jgi:general secretion pathway protein I
MGTRHRGFTLIEILVALAITSIALMAGMQASNALTSLSQRQGDQLLAQVCADNELAKVRLSRQLPGVGRNETTCNQASQTFRVALEVQGTPNPNFRRVDVRVHPSERDITLLQVSTVVGRH